MQTVQGSKEALASSAVTCIHSMPVYGHNQQVLTLESCVPCGCACVTMCGMWCRVFIFKEGLVRFCTTPYKKPTSKNLDCAYMHLTNYAVNKTNTEAFVAPASSKERAGAAAAPAGDESASKWTFLQLRQYLESQGG